MPSIVAQATPRNRERISRQRKCCPSPGLTAAAPTVPVAILGTQATAQFRSSYGTPMPCLCTRRTRWLTMQPTKRSAFPVFAATLLMFVVGGCAGGGTTSNRIDPTGKQAALQCPYGYTVTCEVRKIGRIHHGTFGKDYDSCSCVSTSIHGETRPVVPRL